MFIAHLRNETWKLFGKKRTYIGFGTFLLVQILMLLLFRRLGQHNFERLLSGNGYAAGEFISALTVSVQMLLPQIMLLMPLYASLVGGDLVAKESEDGTLRMILSRPVSRLRLLLAKWGAGVIFAASLVVVLGVIALGLASLSFPWKGMLFFFPRQAFSILSANEGLARYAFAHVFLTINASMILSIAFMFSCFNMKPAAATILALSYVLLNFVLDSIPFFDQYEDWFITHHFRCWMLVFQNPIPWSQIAQSQIILVALGATAFVIGATAFQVRDIKS